MRIKSAIIFLLISAIFLQIMPAAFAYTQDTEKIEIASVISGMDLSETENVTRAQFSRALAMAMTGEIYTDGSQYFGDVLRGDYAFGSISYLAGMGIIKGDGINFHPNNIITKNEAVKMLVMALGYKQVADGKGGYFTGYLAVGTKLKLLEDCSNSEQLTGKDAMVLIYHAMHTKMLSATLFTPEKTKSEISGVTFLEYYRGIYKYTGRVNATAYTGIGGYDATKRDALIVGDIILEKALPVHHTYIGREVDVYYEDNSSYDIVYVKSKEQNYTVYTAEEIADEPSAHSLTSLKLINGNKEVAISPYADFILNGRLHKTVTGADLAFNDGFVELIDNGEENGADIVIINSIEYARVSAIDDIAGIIYGGTGQKYELNEALMYTLTDEKGSPITITEIAEDDLLEVMESSSDSDKILQIKRSRNTFSGKITAVEEAKNGTKLVTVDGNEYPTTRAFLSTDEGIELTTGKYAVFYLSCDNKIAKAKYTDELDMMYGFVLEADSGIVSGLRSEAQLKIFTQENKCEIFDVADKVSVNYSDTKQKESDVVSKLMEGDKAKQQMIRFALNSNGEIRKIYIADELSEYDGESEFYRSPQANFRYTNGSKMIYVYEEKTNAFYIGDAVAYFNVLRANIGKITEGNSARLTENDLYVSYAPHLVESSDSQTIVYDFGDTKNAKCVITEPQDRVVVYDTNLVLVNNVKNFIDKDNDESIQVHGWKKSQKVIYEPSSYMKKKTPDLIAGINRGDLLIVTFDRTEFGQMETVRKVYSADDEWIPGYINYPNETQNTGSVTYGKQTVIKGSVYAADDAVISVDIGEGKQTITTNYITNYYYYDAERKEYIPTSGNEIRTLKDSGEGSRVIIYSRYGVAYDLIILD